MAEQESSNFLSHVPCEKCGSSDANSLYDDGHQFCFSCQHHVKGDGSAEAPARTHTDASLLTGEVTSLGKRGISEATCAKFNYRVGVDRHGRRCQIASYYDGNELVAQKLRFADKTFKFIGTPKRASLFGQQLWRDAGKLIVITEGEIDCMTVSQLQGNKWPVVSIQNGAQSAKRELSKQLEWLERFETVVLMFDMDEAGRAAAAECAPLFTPGRCKVAMLPLKDPNEMLQAGRGSEVIDALWGAKPYRPDGIRSIEELAEEAERDIPWGRRWFLPSLDKLTYGRRDGELYAFGAGTGIGKTDLFTQSIAFDLLKLGLGVGVIYLEQPPVETVRRIAGKVVGKQLHIPGESTVEERRAAIAILTETQRLHLYDNFGATDWDVVKGKIRYMVVSLGCKHIYLDHLTALVASEAEERKALDLIMAEMAALALGLSCTIHFISHLTRPEGKPHEEGGRVMIRHFRGSNAIGMWSHFLIGLERAQQDDSGGDGVTTLRVLKDRNTGRATGKLVFLKYDQTSGLLSETADPHAEDDNPFKDSTPQSKPDF